MGLRDFRVETAIAVSDIDRARRFYGEQVGLGVGVPEPGGVRYTCGEATRIFVYLSPEHAGTTGATIAGWFVDDLDEVMRDLASRSITFEQYDQPGIKTDQHGVFEARSFRAAWFKDPDGNILAVVSE